MKTKSEKQKTSEILHADIFGKREHKYEFLENNSVSTVKWEEIKPQAPFLLFVPQNTEMLSEYEKGFQLNTLFSKNSMGITTGNDDLFIAFTESELKNNFINSSHCQLVAYRIFDSRFINYDRETICRPRFELMKNFFRDNIGLISLKRTRGEQAVNIFLTNRITDKVIISTLDNAQIFPLYLYPDSGELDLAEGKEKSRVPNLNMEIVAKFAKKIGVAFKSSVDIPVCDSIEANSETGKSACPTFTPENLLDYIYAVLHSPNYREKYKEFLKIDFPRIPLPENAEQFWKFVEKGCELRKLHLMESPELDTPITNYPLPGSNVVEKVVWSVGEVRSAGVSPGEEETPPKMGTPLTAWSAGVPPGEEETPPKMGTPLTAWSAGVSPGEEETPPKMGTPLKIWSAGVSPGDVVAQAFRQGASSTRLCSSSGRVFINPTQYFDNVPEISWNFYIGGYQPAQKWLKDRKGRTLSYDDIIHYQKIIVALKRTAEVMGEIDGIKNF